MKRKFINIKRINKERRQMAEKSIEEDKLNKENLKESSAGQDECQGEFSHPSPEPMDNFTYDTQHLYGNSNPQYVKEANERVRQKKQQYNIQNHEWFKGKLELLQNLFYGRLGRDTFLGNSQFFCSPCSSDSDDDCPNVKNVTMFHLTYGAVKQKLCGCHGEDGLLFQFYMLQYFPMSDKLNYGVDLVMLDYARKLSRQSQLSVQRFTIFYNSKIVLFTHRY